MDFEMLFVIQYRNQIYNHEKTLNKDNIRDYIDTFLLEMRQRKNGEKTTFTSQL
jgi:hypothetical protein